MCLRDHDIMCFCGIKIILIIHQYKHNFYMTRSRHVLVNCTALTLIFPLWNASMSFLSVFRFMLGGMKPVSIEMMTLATEQSPEEGSAWPRFDLTEPINNGPFRLAQNTFSIAFTSSGSPTYTGTSNWVTTNYRPTSIEQ